MNKLLLVLAALAAAAPASAAESSPSLIERWTVVEGICTGREPNTAAGLTTACNNRTKFERMLAARGYCVDGPDTPVAHWHKGPIQARSRIECVDNNGNE
jgi:hypothetical protein